MKTGFALALQLLAGHAVIGLVQSAGTSTATLFTNCKLLIRGGWRVAWYETSSTAGVLPNLSGFRNPVGTVRTFSQSGDIDLNGAFFQSLGTNRRNCATCHQPSDAIDISAAQAQNRFDDSDGLDPIFLPNDGSNCDHGIDLSTLAGCADAYSLLRSRGLIRIALAPPAKSQTGTMPVTSATSLWSLVADLAHQTVNGTLSPAAPHPADPGNQGKPRLSGALKGGAASDHAAGGSD